MQVESKAIDPTAWPSFDATLLVEIAAAFLRRHKAIAYRAGEVTCSREFDESGTIERLNIDLWGGHLRVSVWADGVLWASVCIRGSGRNAGWAFRDSFHGDASVVCPAAMVDMTEATLELQLGADPATEREQLREIWERVHPYVS